jgi:hypothetical protein
VVEVLSGNGNKGDHNGHMGDHEGDSEEEHIHLPAPSLWPLVLAAGLTVFALGLVTHWIFVPVGLFLFALGMARWVQQPLFSETHETSS